MSDLIDMASEPAEETNEKPVEWLTLRQTAEDYLGINVYTLYKWVEKGYGPPVYTLSTTYYRYKKHEVEEWIEKRRLCLEDPMFRVISVAETARRLEIHENRLRNWMHEGKGPPVYLFNGRYVYKHAEIDEWIEKNGRGINAGNE